MNKKRFNPENISVETLIKNFTSSPEEAFSQLLQSKKFIGKYSNEFWSAYKKLDINQLLATFPESYDTFQKIRDLNLFCELSNLYWIEIGKCEKKIIELNPHANALVKTLFLCVELGEFQSNFLPNHSEEALESIKNILKKLLPKLNGKDASNYSPQLFESVKFLLQLNIDYNLLFDFIDVFLWADFELLQNEDKSGYTLSPKKNSQKENNLFILNQIKYALKRIHKHEESQPKISEEEHFKKIDPILKTNEGLATVFHSSGVKVKSQTPGTTSLEVDDKLLDAMTSSDKEEKDRATIAMLLKGIEQSFHVQYRDALAEIYQPNDEIDIHSLYVQMDEKHYATLYEIFCVASCISALADRYRYMSALPNCSIKSIKSNFFHLLKTKLPEKSDAEIWHECDKAIIDKFSEIENKNQAPLLHFFSKEYVIGILRKIEELKNKSEQELLNIVDVIASVNSSIPFSPLYKIGNDYFFSPTTCIKFALNRLVYDHFITNKLYNSHAVMNNEAKRKEVGEIQKDREILFTNSIKEVFKKLTPFAESGLKYPDAENNYFFLELAGDIDVIAYFEKENLLIPVQVKLSNTTPHSEKRKSEWVNVMLKKKVIEQVRKDANLLKLKRGLEFVSDKLKLPKNIDLSSAQIYPLIITDNFFADHCWFKYSDKGDKVICISYFELKHLIHNISINEYQDKWNSFEENKSGKYLIELIEKNVFWKFLTETAKEFPFSKSLKIISEGHKISMIV